MDFVFFTVVDWGWSGGAHTPTQLALALAELGHSVVFVQAGRATRDPEPLSVKIISLEDLGWNDLQVARSLHGLEGGPVDGLVNQLLSRVEKRSEPRVAVWFAPFDPFARLHPVMKGANFRTVYMPPDDLNAMAELGFHQFSPKAAEYLAKSSDLIVCYAALADEMRRHGTPVRVLPRIVGLDLSSWHSIPSDPKWPILQGDLTLGFWGYLNSAMFDAEAIEFVAKERPNWAINLFGAYDSEPTSTSVYTQLAGLPNIRFHGFVPQDVLRASAWAFDVCLIPAPAGRFSNGRDPIKLYQYLAAHKPVATTNLPHLGGVPSVYNASNPQEFLLAIETAARAPVDGNLIDKFLEDHLPGHIAMLFAEVVESLPPVTENSEALPAVPLGTFADTNPPLESYLDYLEQELLSVRRWASELESQAHVKEGELKHIRHFLPVRLIRNLNPRWLSERKTDLDTPFGRSA